VNDSFDYASFTIAVTAPLSRGNVTINSTDTNDPPLISPNWLLSTTDQEVAIQGFKVARDIAKMSGITVGPEFFPGPSVQTDAQILEVLKEITGPIHHAVATCTINPFEDWLAIDTGEADNCLQAPWEMHQIQMLLLTWPEKYMEFARCEW